MSCPLPLTVGAAMPVQQITFDQADLVRYAGASQDFNPLHWNTEYAATASPTRGVIVHGMLNLATLVRLVGEWAGGDDRVVSTSVSMRAPCPVGSTVTFRAEVVDVDPDRGLATVRVAAELADGAPVIDGKRSRVVVRL